MRRSIDLDDILGTQPLSPIRKSNDSESGTELFQLSNLKNPFLANQSFDHEVNHTTDETKEDDNLSSPQSNKDFAHKFNDFSTSGRK